MVDAKGYMKRRETDWLVGANSKKQADGYQYLGPAARVSYDKDWLYIVTDDHEGNAMLDIEALSALRRALAQIARERRVAQKAEGSLAGGEQGTAKP